MTALVAVWTFAAVPVAAAAPTSTGSAQATADNVKIRVFNDCHVSRADGTVVSYFGYDLSSPESLDLAAGSADNYVEGADANSGQPSHFTAGSHSFVFSVSWDPSSKQPPAWHVNGSSAKANRGKACKEVPAVPEFPFALVGPVVAGVALAGWFRLRRRSATAPGAV